MRDTVSIDDVIGLLNEVFRLDPVAANAFVENRSPCNEAIADHPTIQVVTRDGVPHFGPLGLLNGLFGVDERGYGPIASYYDDLGKLTGFGRAPTDPREYCANPDSAA